MSSPGPSWVIPPGVEPIIRALLTLDPAGPWRLWDWRGQKTWIDARYRDRQGRAVVLRLLHPSRSPPVPSRRSARFMIAVVEGRSVDGPILDELLDAVAAQVERHEARFAWQEIRPEPEIQRPAPPTFDDPRDIDAEALAFAHGLKPARRLLDTGPDAAYAAHTLLRDGYHVWALIGCVPYPGSPTVTLVARDADTAAALAHAELDQFVHDPIQGGQASRTCGRLLGYPPCCVDAFLDSLMRERDEALDPTRDVRLHGNWRRFTSAWVPRINPLLNTTLLGERLNLISFDPCRLDCPAATAVAAEIAALIERELPLAWAAMREFLLRPVAIDHHDRRAWVELEALGERDPAGEGRARIRSASPIRTAFAEPADPGLAELLPGRLVDAQGHVADLGDLQARVFRFAWPQP